MGSWPSLLTPPLSISLPGKFPLTPPPFLIYYFSSHCFHLLPQKHFTNKTHFRCFLSPTTMVPSTFSFALPLLAILSIWAVDAAHHHATAPSPSSSADCSSLILNMADCLSFVSSGSQTSKPEGTCCSGLKTVLKAGPECLCEAFKSSASLGVTLNITKAMTLPAACKVSAPSATNCATSLTPAGAPGMSPSAFSGGASQVAPAPAPGNSSAYPVLTVSMGSLILGLIVMLTSSYY